VGIVSIRDIIEHIVDHFPEEVYNLPPQPLHRGWGGAREGA
jgi:CBS domain containing-hemolysin-like protein